MKTVLPLLILATHLIAFGAFSQDPKMIYPFEDYRMCYTGFRTYAGDTIYPAKFESVYQERSTYKWIVEEQGRYGILSTYGELILPTQYDTIYNAEDRYFGRRKNDWLIIGSDGKYGIIDTEGNKILPVNYQQIELHHRWFKVRNSAGKVGLLDTTSFQVEVPFEYDDLFCEVLRDFSMDTLVYFSHFLAKKNGDFGLLKLDLTPILPFEFEKIRVERPEENYVINQPYIYTTKSEKKGLYTYDGKPIIPHKYEGIQLADKNYRYYKKNNIQTARTIDGKEQTYFNVETGAQSEPFRQIRLFGGKAIGDHKNGKWSVIDTNGSIMGTGSKEWYANEETLDLRDSIVEVSTSSKGNQKQFQRLLYHYGKGEFSSERCSWLMRMELDNESYCWSISDKTMTIYDSQLRKIKTLNGEFTDILEDLEDEGIPFPSQIAVLENNKGLIGGFDARGNEVIPQKYTKATVILKEERHKHFNYFKIVDYFEFSNDSSKAHYSLTGELIKELNVGEVFYLSNTYLLSKSRGFSSILDQNYNLVLDSCSHAFQSSTLKSNWSANYYIGAPNPYSVYAIRNQKYYAEMDGKFVLMDSSRFDFKNKLKLQFKVLIDRSGSVVSPKDAQIQKNGSHYIVEQADSLIILSLEGKAELEIGRVSEVKIQSGGMLLIRFQNYDQGIYSLNAMNWLMPPEPQRIQRLNRNHSSAQYCILRERINDKWQFYSASGVKISEIGLDYGLSYLGRSNLVAINGRIGVMTDQFKMILPPEYDYISDKNGRWFLRENKKWHISTGQFKAISKGYSVISTQIYPQGQLVFEGELIGVVDHNFQERIPLSTEEELLQKYDLAALLYPIDRHFGQEFPIISEDNAELARTTNNRIILEASRFLTTNNDMMPLALQHNVKPENVRRLKYQELVRNETPYFFSKSYYSCGIYTSSKRFGDPNYKRKVTGRNYNYEWKNGELVEFQLGDLFIDYTYLPHLDSLIVAYLNKSQLYGISCVDLVETIAMAKENFVLKPEGILFFATAGNNDTLLIPYHEFDKFLKRPEEFVGLKE